MALALVCGHLTCRTSPQKDQPLRCADALAGSFFKRHAVRPVWASKRSQTRALRLLVGRGVQGLFHSPCGVLFTFPSRYSFPIGGQEYLALEGGPPCFPQDASCPVVLRHQTRRAQRPLCLPDSHRLWWAVPGPSARHAGYRLRGGPPLRRRPVWPYNPARTLLPGPRRFGLLPPRSPLLRESLV
jgi:hypothetical protein